MALVTVTNGFCASQAGDRTLETDVRRDGQRQGETDHRMRFGSNASRGIVAGGDSAGEGYDEDGGRDDDREDLDGQGDARDSQMREYINTRARAPTSTADMAIVGHRRARPEPAE